MDESLKKELVDDCKLSTRIMNLMTSQAILSESPLSSEHIRDCKALAFMNIKKGGLGLTLAMGNGFVVRKLPNDQWSAPYFFKLSQVGVGITIGFNEVDCVLVMNKEENITKLATGDGMKMGADLWITSAGVGGLGHSMGASGDGEVARLDESPDKLWAFQQGLMMGNIAINGTETKPDNEKNAKLYGSATAEQVLSGPSPVPEVQVAFAPLGVCLHTLDYKKPA